MNLSTLLIIGFTLAFILLITILVCIDARRMWKITQENKQRNKKLLWKWTIFSRDLSVLYKGTIEASSEEEAMSLLGDIVDHTRGQIGTVERLKK